MCSTLAGNKLLVYTLPPSLNDPCPSQRGLLSRRVKRAVLVSLLLFPPLPLRSSQVSNQRVCQSYVTQKRLLRLPIEVVCFD